MQPVDPEISPIFVVGTGRSGTTLIRLMLNAHPRIYITQEASFYLLTRLGLPANFTPRQWLHRYLQTPAFAWLNMKASAILARLPREPGPGKLAEVFSLIMRSKAEHYGRIRYGDKTPTHSAYLWRIFNDFKDPKVIHMVRDPRGTVASLIRMPWAPGSIWLNSFYCDQQMKSVRSYRRRIHEVRLEDLLADPEPVMRSVLEFVGEPWDRAVLDHQNQAPLDDVPPFPWFQRARANPRPVDGTPEWQRQLSPAWIRIIERMNTYGMKCYHYQPVELDHEPGRLSCLTARLAEIFKIVSSLHRLIRFARLYQKKELPEPQIGMEALLQVNPRAWSHYPDFTMPRVPKVDY